MDWSAHPARTFVFATLPKLAHNRNLITLYFLLLNTQIRLIFSIGDLALKAVTVSSAVRDSEQSTVTLLSL